MKKNIIISLICISLFTSVAAQGQNTRYYTADEAINFLRGVHSVSNSIADTSVKQKESKIVELQKQQTLLINELERGKVSEKIFEVRNKQLEADLDTARQELCACRQKTDAAQSAVESFAKKAFDAGLEISKDEKLREKEIIVAAATARESKKAEMAGLVEVESIKGQHLMSRLKFLSDPENLKQYSFYLSTAAAGVATAYFGIKVLAQKLQDYLRSVPDIAEETSLSSIPQAVIEDIKQFFFGTTAPDLKNDIILDPELEKRLFGIANTVRDMHKAGLELPSLLLYGPPGTGKTWFAKLLARQAGMDYVIMSADRFSQFAEGEDVQQMHQLFKWAENSPRGMIIFIDEIDALGCSRDNLDTRWIRLQNAFLAHTGSISHKFMIIGATNRPHSLDTAFLDRFPERIMVGLPGCTERAALLKMYIDKQLRGRSKSIIVNNQKKDITISLADNINDAFYHQLAAEIEGLSGRAIMQVITTKILRRAFSSNNGFKITQEMIRSAFAERMHDATHTKNYAAAADHAAPK